MRPAGVGPSDYLAPLTLERSEPVYDAIRSVLQDLSKRHLVDLHQMPSDHPFTESLLSFERIDQAKCLVLDLPTSFEEYVAGLSKSLRYDVRRLEGKALKEKGARVEWIALDTVDAFAEQ